MLIEPETERESISSSEFEFLRRTAAKRLPYAEDPAEKLLLKNLPLIPFFAKPYVNQGLDYGTLLSLGLSGLWEAAQRFDLNRGSFSTYARYWIIAKITRELSTNRKDIHLPAHLESKRKKVRDISLKLQAALGYKPSLEEISEATGLSVTSLENLYTAGSPVLVSIDQEVSIQNADGGSLIELIPDPTAPRPDEVLMENERHETAANVSEQLKKLNVRERDKQIFAHFHNLDGSLIPQTLDSTGGRFGLTSERVRQIKNRVAQKLAGKSRPEPNGEKPRKRAAALRKPVHIRASPAFVTWKPRSQDLVAAAFELVADAYELTTEAILSWKCQKELSWARQIVAMILLEDAGYRPELVSGFFLGYLGSLDEAIFRTDFAVQNDPVVRKDVEEIRAHYRKTFELQQ